MDNMKDRIAKTFERHVATFQEFGYIKLLEWKQPASCTYAMRCVIDHNVLHISGDFGEASYCFSQQLSWVFLAGCNLDYFASKCQSSPYGRGFKSFDSYLLEQEMKENIEEIKKEMAEDNADFDFYSKSLAAIEDSGWQSNTGSKEEWMLFLNDNGYDMWGDDWYESYPDGMRIDYYCRMHLEGIKAAMKGQHK